MPEWTKPQSATLSIGILLFDRFSNLCLANCLEPLRAANMIAGRELYRWTFLAPGGGPVHSSSDLPILAEDPGKVGGTFDRLLILASYDHISHDNATNRTLLRALARRSRQIVGHDAGPWLMAAAGLLDGLRATAHRDLIDSFAARFPRVEALAAPRVRDGRIETSAGALAALDQTLAMIARDAGAALALDIEALFLRDGPGTRLRDPRQRIGGSSAIERMLAAMRTSLDAPMSLAELARKSGTTARSLDRLCRATFGASPLRVHRHMRLTAAWQLVTTTALPVTEIAARCGYENTSAFARAFRLRFGVSPLAARSSNGLASAGGPPQF